MLNLFQHLFFYYFSDRFLRATPLLTFSKIWIININKTGQQAVNLLKDITIGQYVPGKSCIHRIDPRIKIMLMFILMIQIFLTSSWSGFIIFALFFIGVTIASQLPFFYVIRGLKPIFFLVCITLFLNVFFSRGTVIWQYRLDFLWSFTIQVTREGVDIGTKMAARLLLLVFSTSLLTLSTSTIQLTDAIEHLLKPFKVIGVPAHELALMITIALRFIPVLIEETDKIFRAQRSRGAAFGQGNIFNKAKSLLPVMVPLFVHAFKHAEDLAAAMESRCYKGAEGRTRLKQLRISGLDITAVLLTGVILAGTALWDVYRAI
jgi:energy-coupling factor transport system permease protein